MIVTINSYAGSLILGCLEATGELPAHSLEDCGYGAKIQRLNFPALDVRETPEQWPSLYGPSIIIAHPPCAEFSVQKQNRCGVDGAKFGPTRLVFDYAATNRVDALAVESVCGAREGARAFHDAWAVAHGYGVFRLVQSADQFGCPQKRKRFWAVFLRGRHEFQIERPTGERMALKSCLGGGTPIARLDAKLAAKFVELDHAGLPARRLLSGEFGFGLLKDIVARFDSRVDPKIAGKGFVTHMLRLLDPEKPATTLLSDSFWCVPNRDSTFGCRTICREEFSAIMGFPLAHKIVPPSAHRAFLSRGVCPPVAAWILRSIIKGGDLVVRFGETLDLTA